MQKRNLRRASALNPQSAIQNPKSIQAATKLNPGTFTLTAVAAGPESIRLLNQNAVIPMREPAGVAWRNQPSSVSSTQVGVTVLQLNFFCVLAPKSKVQP